MSSAPRYSADDLRATFARYGLMQVSVVCEEPRMELWKTGWDEPIVLTPEADGTYDDFAIRRIRFLVDRTIPPGWNIGKR